VCSVIKSRCPTQYLNFVQKVGDGQKNSSRSLLAGSVMGYLVGASHALDGKSINMLHVLLRKEDL